MQVGAEADDFGGVTPAGAVDGGVNDLHGGFPSCLRGFDFRRPLHRLRHLIAPRLTVEFACP
jgi:hypothetical protein